MAMRIGGEYGVEGVSSRHWHRFADLNELDPDEIVARVEGLVARIPDCFAKATQDDAVRAVNSALPTRLLDRIAGRADQCRRALTKT